MPKVIDETRILRAAIDILMSLGYDGATVKEIAALADVNEVTLFRNYGSKAGLFEKAIQHQLADTPLNHLEYSGDLEADMLAVVDAYIQTNQEQGDIIAIILIELPRNPELQRSVDIPMNNLQGVIEIIRKYQEQGMLKKESPLAAVSALLGPVMIHQMFRRANLKYSLPALDPKVHVDAFLNGRKRSSLD
ncbi:MAG: TetR/AcrR family transcriptional regulator [Anaerolineales bacterium]